MGARHNAFQLSGGCVRNLRSLVHGGNGMTDRRLGGLGCLRALGRQIPDFVGSHGEALARCARPRGLYRSVQRKDIGLEGSGRESVDGIAPSDRDVPRRLSLKRPAGIPGRGRQEKPVS
jgi:hypothetical protein